MTRIATAAQHSTLLAELLRSNERLFNTQLQITTGKVAQSYKDIARDTGVLLSAKRVETRTDQYQKTISEIGGRLENQNIQLEGLSSAAAELRQNVLDAVSLDKASGLMESVESIFRQSISVLNAQLDGNHIFAGSRTDQPPVTATSLADLIAAPTAADLFQNDHVHRTIEVDTSQTVDYTFFADAIGEPLMGALKRIAEFNAGPNGPFADELTEAQRTFLQGELPALKTISEQLNLVVARNGQVQNEVADANGRHDQTNVFIKGFISDIEDVDLAEAVSRLNQDQVASEASAKILADLHRVSLLDFLR